MKTTTLRRACASPFRAGPVGNSSLQTLPQRLRRPRLQVLATWLILCLTTSLGTVMAANLLTNPGFEAGQTGWSNPNLVRGGTSLVITDPALAHSGNNCISNNNLTGWSSAEQGDSMGGWGTGVSLPVSSANYYKLSAWVKVPGAATNAQSITLRYRFEPSGSRVDVGTKLINTEAWTLLETEWIQPPGGDYFMSYWEVHSLNNGVIFFADDCGLEESLPLTLQGRVVDGMGAGVDGANVSASSSSYTAPATTTSGGGYYFLMVPAGTYKVAANTPGFKGSVTLAVSTSPTTASDITLVTDPDYDADLIFNAKSADIVVGTPWPTVNPAGGVLTVIGTPGVKSYGGVQWEQNNADGPGYRLGTYSDPIPVNGASIVVVAKPKRMGSDNWDSIVDVFYNELMLGIRNDTGLVNVFRKGFPARYSATAIPEGQSTVLSLVVQPTGEFKVWANGVEIMNDTSTADMTSLIPNVPGTYANAINVGRNNPDGWTTFNGNIGDVYLYKVALDEAKRVALENSLMTKFITNATLSYTITASADANGSISPTGPTSVVQGYNQTFTITANPGYVVSSVLVDGVSVGTVTSYTFANVSANHTISASFVAMPPQTITSSAGPNGTISPLGAISVPAGSSQTFQMLPNDGYKVADVLVDGVSQGALGSYTFNFVVAPHTISVTFAAIDRNLPRTEQILFSVVTDVLTNGFPTGPWPLYLPSGQSLTVLAGSPFGELVGSTMWERNVSAPMYDAFQLGGSYASPIPCDGATIILAAAPVSDPGSGNPWTSIVDVFYDRLVLGIRNDTGQICVRCNGNLENNGPVIPYMQPVVLSLVVQADGSYKVYADGHEVMAGMGGGPMTSLVPGGPGYQKFINLGRNNPDGWTTFNGYIGDTFVYKIALTDAQRGQVENIVKTKFAPPAPPAAPVVSAIAVDPGTGVPSFTVDTVSGHQYRLLYTEDLSAKPVVWTAVVSAPDNPGPSGWSSMAFGVPIVISDPGAPGRPQRFYRAQVW
jgi:hypothetical protein